MREFLFLLLEITRSLREGSVSCLRRAKALTLLALNEDGGIMALKGCPACEHPNRHLVANGLSVAFWAIAALAWWAHHHHYFPF